MIQSDTSGTQPAGGTTIATWFVADDAATATFFPQVGSRSDAPETQAVYWRCVLCFYASSLVLNPAQPHVFFTNTALPTIDGIDFAAVFARWKVAVVRLPITYRLPKGAVEMWGNQFYIFDILAYLSRHGTNARHVVLDSDCLWLKPVNALADTIDRHGVATYQIGADEHAMDMIINGRSRADLARYIRARGGKTGEHANYLGGEIFAATQEQTALLSAQIATLWPDITGNVADAPREEAHALSVLYALNGYAAGTANPFIRRMWTTFHRNNLARSDRDLAIWHLASEKRSGFAAMFAAIAPLIEAGAQPAALGLDPGRYARWMGYPRRSPAKFVRDLTAKLREKLRVRP
jgi:hypothetical protein